MPERRMRIRAAWAAVLLLGAAPAGAGTVGTVTGVVRLAGPAPTRPGLPVFKNKEVCGETVPDDRLVVGPGGGLRYAVVTIEGVHGGRQPEPNAMLIIDNHACRFEPHVQTAEVGQWLEIWNGDPLLHNADARLGGETLFNLALPPDRRLRRPLGRPGTIALTCEMRHTWMSAFVVVADHPYHTVTDAYGAYEIDEIPPGKYTLKVWHEELGTREQPLSLEPGTIKTVDVTFEPPAKEVTR